MPEVILAGVQGVLDKQGESFPHDPASGVHAWRKGGHGRDDPIKCSLEAVMACGQAQFWTVGGDRLSPRNVHQGGVGSK
jgi:hypothetical protein